MRQREAAELVVAERAGGVAGVGAAGGQKGLLTGEASGAVPVVPIDSCARA